MLFPTKKVVTTPSYNFGAYNLPYQSEASGILYKLNTDRQVSWSTYLGSLYLDPLGISTYNTGGAAQNKGIAIAGRADPLNQPLPYTSSCDLPQIGEYPLCDGSGQYYTENDANNGVYRMFLMLFDENDNIQWSTLYGCGSSTTFFGLASDEDRLVTVGYADVHNTIFEYDPGSGLDYFRGINPPTDLTNKHDGAIAMFDLSDIVTGVGDLDPEFVDNLFNVGPNPFLDYLYINSGEFLEETFEISLFNNLGQLVLNDNLKKGTISNSIYTEEIGAGVYVLQIKSEKKTLFTAKVVKN